MRRKIFPPILVVVLVSGCIEMKSQDLSKVFRKSPENIAESSYTVLANVPEVGLRNSQGSIKKIIYERKLLENTGDAVAQMLAMNLQYAVDGAVFNEIYRSVEQQYGQPLISPFQNDSFDNKLVDELLRENEIDEYKYIDFALSANIEIAEFCMENGYGANDFLTCRIFEEAWQHMKISIETDSCQRVDIRNADPMLEAIWIGKKQKSKRELANFLLPMALRRIDEARDVRLLASIYSEYGGFGGANLSNKCVLDSDVLQEHILSGLLKSNKNRLTHRHLNFRWELPTFMDASKVTEKMKKRVNAYGMGDDYTLNLNLLFVPFIQNSEVLPKGFRKVASKQSLVGMWLNLSD